MEDEKMMRAMVAGHVFAAMLAQEHEAPTPDGLVSYGDIAREAVIATDALLVELKKDSPAPAEDCPPPPHDAAGAGDVVPEQVSELNDGNATRIQAAPLVPCEAIGCAALGDRFFFCGPRENPWSEEAHFCSLHAAVRPPSILLEWHRVFLKKARAA
jgi:hypothetical protein